MDQVWVSVQQLVKRFMVTSVTEVCQRLKDREEEEDSRTEVSLIHVQVLYCNLVHV